jgi:small subunit ribosomal protein S9
VSEDNITVTETDVDTLDVDEQDEQYGDIPAEPEESFATRPIPPRMSAIEPAAATGRRKEAVARVRIVPGTGKWQINGRDLDDYFPNKVHQQLVSEPFVVLDLRDKYDVIARVHGGGASGQAGALRLGVARALNLADMDNNRPVLKKNGFLTRDARVTERKKAGLKKARKAPQYSKR